MIGFDLGGEVLSASASTLAHSDIHAQNTFDDPEQIRPTENDLKIRGAEFYYTFLRRPSPAGRLV